MFRGMIMGMMMMVGGVYAADSMAGADARPIVNWDVAAARSIDAAHFVRDEFARLSFAGPRAATQLSIPAATTPVEVA
jgi:hypothetical protein